MLFKPLLGTALSGKVGGIVASHNAGGAYFRTLAIPTNPNSVQQVAVRSAFAGLATTWSNVLTQAQRDIWTAYADNMRVTNRIGEQITLTGLAMFTRTQTARRAAGLLPDVLDGPVIFTDAVMFSLAATLASEATQQVTIPFNTSTLLAPWANEEDSFLMVYLSPPQSPSINFYRGPYRFAGSIEGDPIPPTTPLLVNAPFAFVEGHKIFTRQIVSQADGRISAATERFVIATA